MIRPDVMLVKLTDIERGAYMAGEEMTLLNAAMQNNLKRRVWIVERGYCTDTRYSDTYRRKEHSMNTYRHCCRHVDLR